MKTAKSNYPPVPGRDIATGGKTDESWKIGVYQSEFHTALTVSDFLTRHTRIAHVCLLELHSDYSEIPTYRTKHSTTFPSSSSATFSVITCF